MTAPTMTSDAQRKDAGRVKAQRTLDLRAAGATFQQIADALGYSDRSAARKAFHRALDAEVAIGAEQRETLRQQQQYRLEQMLRAVWPNALRGDVKAQERVLRILERQARLLGLDAPVNLRVSDGLDAEIEAMLEEMQRLAEQQAAAALQSRLTAEGAPDGTTA